MSRESTGEKTPIHRRAHILIVSVRAALGTVLISAIAQAKYILVSGVVGFAVQCRLGIRRVEDFSQVPVPVMLPLIPHLVQSDPRVVAEIHQRGWIGIRCK